VDIARKRTTRSWT